MAHPLIPFRAEHRADTIAVIKERFGEALGSYAAGLGDDELEELAFRISCGELGPLNS